MSTAAKLVLARELGDRHTDGTRRVFEHQGDALAMRLPDPDVTFRVTGLRQQGERIYGTLEVVGTFRRAPTTNGQLVAGLNVEFSSLAERDRLAKHLAQLSREWEFGWDDLVEALAARAVAEAVTPLPGGLTPGLPFLSIRELSAKVAAEGPRQYLVRGLWPAGDYGVHSAEPKAQKTWFSTDWNISIASATPFLNRFPVDTPGPVLMFTGEGGEGNVLQRLRAVAQSRGLSVEDLPITVCARAPHLGDDRHLAQVAEALASTGAVSVTVDPYYLSARGTNAQSVIEAGAVLERIQHICQEARASLLVIHHNNRSRDAKGALRMSGAGPAEWGRVLIVGDVVSRHTDPQTRGTSVVTELEVIGGQIADQSWRVHRRIWADDPDDLNSPLHYEVTVEDADRRASTDAADTSDRLSPAAQKLLDALRGTTGLVSAATLVDAVVQRHGHGLRRETVSRSLGDLERRGLAQSVDTGQFKEKLWRIPDAQPEATA